MNKYAATHLLTLKYMARGFAFCVCMLFIIGNLILFGPASFFACWLGWVYCITYGVAKERLDRQNHENRH